MNLLPPSELPTTDDHGEIVPTCSPIKNLQSAFINRQSPEVESSSSIEVRSGPDRAFTSDPSSLAMLAFVHIPKTAGTTLHKVISHQYPREKIFIHHDTEGPPSAELAARIEAQGISVVMGHFSVGLHRYLPSLRYVTCLRDPVPRLVSHYRHALHDPTHYLHHEAKSRSLAEYVSSGLSGELSDGMTRMLAGVGDFHHAEVDKSTLDLAISNLEKYFDAWLITELFDSHVLNFAHQQRWSTPWYIKRKTGKGAASTVDPQTRAAILSSNLFDHQLYVWARDQAVVRMSPDSPGVTQLKRFRALQPAWGKSIFCYREFIRRLGM